MESPSQQPPTNLPPGPLPHNTNRRFSPRIRAPFCVKAMESELQLSGIDLSFGGILVTCNVPVWAGTTLRLRLALPEATTTVTVDARVVELTTYRKKTAARMLFVKPSPQVLEQIATWMGRLSEQRDAL